MAPQSTATPAHWDMVRELLARHGPVCDVKLPPDAHKVWRKKLKEGALEVAGQGVAQTRHALLRRAAVAAPPPPEAPDILDPKFKQTGVRVRKQCGGCGGLAIGKFTCGGCHGVMYCGKGCQVRTGMHCQRDCAAQNLIPADRAVDSAKRQAQ